MHNHRPGNLSHAHAEIAIEERRNTSTGTPLHQRQSQPCPTHSLNYELIQAVAAWCYQVHCDWDHRHKKQGSKWDTYLGYWSTLLYGNRSDIWKNYCIHTNLNKHHAITTSPRHIWMTSFGLDNTIVTIYWLSISETTSFTADWSMWLIVYATNMHVCKYWRVKQNGRWVKWT